MNLYIHILLIFVIFTHFDIANTSHIVLLRGTCSSGKSSLIAALQNMDSRWYAIEEDSFFVEATLHAVTQNFPTEMSIISQVIASQNIFNAVKRSEFQFLPGTSSEEQQSAYNAVQQIQAVLDGEIGNQFKQELFRAIENAMDAELQNAVERNENILLDAWAYNRTNLQEKLPGTSLYTVLVYCPLEIALTRVEERNNAALHSGNLLATRFYKQLLASYMELYEWQLPIDEVIIPESAITPPDFYVDCFYSKEILEIFSKFERRILPAIPTTSMAKRNFTWTEMDATKFSSLQRDFLRHLNRTLGIEEST